jgi:GT2 family glycosyltransferase
MDNAKPLNLPPTSLTICSRNRPKLLIECVQSVLHGDNVPTELVIVDQSDAPEETLAALKTDRDCRIRYLSTQTVGVGRARNAAIAAAQHDIIVLIDDDEVVTVDWFGTLVRALIISGQRSVVTGKVLSTEAEAPDGFAPSTKADENPAVYEGRTGEDVLYTGNMALYRSALDEVGMYDGRLGPGTSFPGAEDNDFAFRLLEAGYRIIYVPEAIVYHSAWRSDRDYLALRWSYARGQGAFFAKYLSLRDRYMLSRMVKSLKDHLLGFARCLPHQRRLAYGNAIYVLGLLTAAIQWLLMERVIGSVKKICSHETSQE